MWCCSEDRRSSSRPRRCRRQRRSSRVCRSYASRQADPPGRRRTSRYSPPRCTPRTHPCRRCCSRRRRRRSRIRTERSRCTPHSAPAPARTLRCCSSCRRRSPSPGCRSSDTPRRYRCTGTRRTRRSYPPVPACTSRSGSRRAQRSTRCSHRRTRCCSRRRRRRSRLSSPRCSCMPVRHRQSTDTPSPCRRSPLHRRCWSCTGSDRSRSSRRTHRRRSSAVRAGRRPRGRTSRASPADCSCRRHPCRRSCSTRRQRRSLTGTDRRPYRWRRSRIVPRTLHQSRWPSGRTGRWSCTGSGRSCWSRRRRTEHRPAHP